MAPDIENYRKLKNQLKIYVREAKLSYLKELLQKAREDPRLSAQLWSGVNNVLGRCRSHCDGVTCPLSPERVNNFFGMLLFHVIINRHVILFLYFSQY